MVAPGNLAGHLSRVNGTRFVRSVAALWPLLVLLLGLVGCRPRVTVYPVRGVVRELKADGTNVVIKHDEIPGYMAAMTMNFDAPAAAVLQGLKPQDVVTFQLHVSADDSWVDGFNVLSNAGPAAVTSSDPVVLNDPTAVSFFKAVPELKVGEVVPEYALNDYVFTNQFGKPIRLADYRGKVVAFTFLFTRCPLPDFCPRLSQRFRTAQRTLKERALPDLDWQLFSLSFDPLYDSTKVLESYGKRYDADFSRWTFATGAYEPIHQLGAHFGLYFGMNVTPDKLNHNMRTVVLDRNSRIQGVLVGNSWNSEELVNALIAAGSVK